MLRRLISFPKTFIIVFPKIWLFVFLSLVALDLGSKKWITNELNFPYSFHNNENRATELSLPLDKRLATKNGRGQIPLLGKNGEFFKLRLAFNDKFAFGIGPNFIGGWGILFSVGVTFLATCILFLYRWHNPDLGNRWAWVMVFSGAIGNLIDKMFVKSFGTREWTFSLVPIEGHATGVVDFLHVIWFGWRDAPVAILRWQSWPVFNLADSLVVIGMIVLIFTINTETDKIES